MYCEIHALIDGSGTCPVCASEVRDVPASQLDIDHARVAAAQVEEPEPLVLLLP